jgi:hypothetical protein
MSGQPANLRPYGDSWSNSAPGVEGGTMEEQALSRAHHKLETVRSGRSGDREAGTDLMLVVPWAIFALLFGGPFFALALAVLVEGKQLGLGFFFLLLSLPVLSIPVIIFLRTRPTSTKGALLGYYRALARKRYARARKLVINADLDGFPRHQPMIANLGAPTNYPRPFADENAFGSYWRELMLEPHAMPYCRVSIHKVHENDVAPDVKIVDFEMRLTMNTGLYALLFLVIGIFAFIIDAATQKKVHVNMRKMMVRVGEEWHLFSGEWQGYEEFNTGWLSGGHGGPAAPVQQGGGAMQKAPWE